MSYSNDGTASFVGFERVCGVISDKHGTFIIQHSGSFSEGKARSTWSVVKGSGTGVLAVMVTTSQAMASRPKCHLNTRLNLKTKGY